MLQGIGAGKYCECGRTTTISSSEIYHYGPTLCNKGDFYISIPPNYIHLFFRYFSGCLTPLFLKCQAVTDLPLLTTLWRGCLLFVKKFTQRLVSFWLPQRNKIWNFCFTKSNGHMSPWHLLYLHFSYHTVIHSEKSYC